MALYRQRLRSSQGCARCKQRHVKCDEAKPSCSLCRRRSRECVYPEVVLRSGGERSNHQKPSQSRCLSLVKPRKASKQLNRESKAVKSSRDSSSKVTDLRSKIKQSTIFTYLEQFFVLIVRQNLPYKGIRIRNSMACGWFESALRDEAACFALLTHWAKDQSRVTGSDEMRLLGLRYEIRTTTLLRQRIECGAVLSEDVLLAAAIHYMSATFNVINASQLDSMLCGMKAVVTYVGGMSRIAATMKPSTVFSVQYTDIFNAIVNAKQPSFVQLDKPIRPKTFSTMFKPQTLNKLNPVAYFEAEVVEMVESIDFLLFFRNPSQQNRSLSDEEYTYLCSLEHWLNYRLSVLQHKYAGTASMTELMIVAMIIVKMEIVAKECSHTILVLTILNRLKTAIVACHSKLEKSRQASAQFESLSIWICVVALVGQSLSHERSWFACYLQAALVQRYGKDSTDWPYCMVEQLRCELRHYSWHSRIDLCLVSTCDGLRNLQTLDQGDEHVASIRGCAG